jgi:hypothetical protein
MSCYLGCSILLSSTIDKKTILTKRVEKAYEYWKERRGDKFMDLYYDEFYKKMSTQEKIDKFERWLPNLVEYNIKEIEISGENAKVKVDCVGKFGKEPGEVLIIKNTNVDYWIFKDNEWYLYNFGKAR